MAQVNLFNYESLEKFANDISVIMIAIYHVDRKKLNDKDNRLNNASNENNSHTNDSNIR